MQPGAAARTIAIIALLAGGLVPLAGRVVSPAHASDPAGRGFLPDSLHRWSCVGAFANGRPLAAEISMESILGGRATLYRQHDRPPGRYEVAAILPAQPADSGAALTRLWDNGGGHREFGVTTDSLGTIRLRRDVSGTAYDAERFTLRPRAGGALWFAWEIRRGGTWILGDSLACQPSAD